MFDYLLGEETPAPALVAEQAAAAMLLLSKRPVISVNGNLAALCLKDIVALSKATGAVVEVNLFHWTEGRAKLIREQLEAEGARNVLAEDPDALLDGIHHDRAKCHSKGIFSADAVLVPLEDGDRARALADMGKKVISIDLNPLSRTTLCATVSIVDEVTRALQNIVRFYNGLADDEKRAGQIVASYDNVKTLRAIYRQIADRFEKLVKA
jgi:4-phosphopantoate--beta-alanine ligase